jgi:hypothetical protein
MPINHLSRGAAVNGGRTGLISSPEAGTYAKMTGKPPVCQKSTV